VFKIGCQASKGITHRNTSALFFSL